MKLYDKTRPIYLKINKYGVVLGTGLLKKRDGINCPWNEAPTILILIVFASKSLSSIEKRYSNIEREAIGILQGLEKFYHYCFVRQVCIIMDHKPL